MLESEDGCTMELTNGRTYIIRGTLIGFIGDTLAAHEIFELLSPSCNCFCRQCMCTRQSLKDGTGHNSLKRTKILHEEHLRKIEYGELMPSDCGVRTNSALNELKYFHSAENMIYDVMHDLLEGIL